MKTKDMLMFSLCNGGIIQQKTIVEIKKIGHCNIIKAQPYY